MKLGRADVDGRTLVLLVDADGCRPVSLLPGREAVVDVADLIQAPLSETDLGRLRQSPPIRCPVTWLPPIAHPPKNVICVGKNYVEHVHEGARAEGVQSEVPGVPVFFTKPPTALVGCGATVRVPPSHARQLDYEGELAVVIGRRSSRTAERDALAHVFGYTVLNDLTARDVQQAHKQWFFGKGFDGAAPCGPWVVTADEIADPQALEITTRVNGEVRQRDLTGAMIFPVASLIVTLSSAITLEPGDILATGTPSGVAWGMSRPRYLADGDRVSVEIAGIGELWNTIQLS